MASQETILYFSISKLQEGPDFVTDITGIKPWAVSRLGQKRNPHVPPARQNAWTIKSEVSPKNNDLQDHWLSIKAMLDPHRDFFREIGSGCSKEFRAWVSGIDTKTGLQFGQEIISFANDIGATIEIEIYVE